MGQQWHQLDHMQIIYNSLYRQPCWYLTTQFLQARCPSCRPTNSVTAQKAKMCHNKMLHIYFTLLTSLIRVIMPNRTARNWTYGLLIINLTLKQLQTELKLICCNCDSLSFEIQPPNPCEVLCNPHVALFAFLNNKPYNHKNMSIWTQTSCYAHEIIGQNLQQLSFKLLVHYIKHLNYMAVFKRETSHHTATA